MFSIYKRFPCFSVTIANFLVRMRAPGSCARRVVKNLTFLFGAFCPFSNTTVFTIPANHKKWFTFSKSGAKVVIISDIKTLQNGKNSSIIEKKSTRNLFSESKGSVFLGNMQGF